MPVFLLALLIARLMSGFMLLVLSVQALAVDAIDALKDEGKDEGQALSLRASSQPQRVPLALAAGDYIQGKFTAGNSSIKLRLLDADGKALRQFVPEGQSAGEFFFVAQPGMSLQLQAKKSTQVSLAFVHRIAVADQPSAQREYISPQIAAIAKAIAAGGSTDAFWQQVKAQGSPLVEAFDAQRRVMTFVWRGARQSVQIIGAPTNDHQHLERLGQSDIWYKSFIVPHDTRLSYRLVVDAPELPAVVTDRWGKLMAAITLDPFNQHPWPADADSYVRDSTVTLPDAPAQPWSELRNSSVGSLKHSQFTSEVLGNTRAISLYQSPGFKADSPDTLLLFVFDAQEFLTLVPTPRILDNLVAAGRLPQVAAVFVGNPTSTSRNDELPNNEMFARFMAQELYPWVSKQVGAKIPPARTALAGSSYGGLAATTVALRQPQVFGNVVSLSGSFWWRAPGTSVSDPSQAAAMVLANPAATKTFPLRFFISAGRFEGVRDGELGILHSSRQLRDLLVAKGYEQHYREYSSGHDYLAWQGALADGLLDLFGKTETP